MSISSSSPPIEPVPLSVPTLASRLQDANERKADGNDYFRQSKWNEALVAYQSGLNLLPKRAPFDPTGSPTEEEDDLPSSSSDLVEDEGPAHSDAQNITDPDVDPKAKESEEITLTEDEKKEVAQLRAVLYANIGACHVKLGEHKEAVAACTQALKDDPTYVKALQRRAGSNEILDTWSSLSAAQEDYKTLLTLLQPAPQKRDVESKLQKLKPRLEAAQQRETSEMLGKLKGLGNSLLGNFGLSTDNFKFEPNGQGGYSMNFVR